MNKFSYVVPTMGRYEPFWQFLEDLCHFDVIDEILVIDNDKTKTLRNNHPKVKWLGDGNNMGVNPAWNLGIAKARNECICVANDDIVFALQTFYRVQDALSDEKPLIGMSAGDPIWKQPPITDGTIQVTPWITGESTHGFGCLWFIKKSWFVPIPENLKIYYGDNWVADTTFIRGKNIHLLTNFPYCTPFAQTTKEVGGQEILMKEHRMYGEELRKWQTTR